MVHCIILYTILYHTIYYTVPYYILYFTITVLYYAVLCCSMLYPLYYTIIRYTRLLSLFAFDPLSDWTEVPIERLDLVFRDAVLSGTVPLETRLMACDLILACLQGDPVRRPTVQQVLDHPFLSCTCDGTEALPRLGSLRGSLDVLGRHQYLVMTSFDPIQVQRISSDSKQAAILTAAQLLDESAVVTLLCLGADASVINASGNNGLHMVSETSHVLFALVLTPIVAGVSRGPI